MNAINEATRTTKDGTTITPAGPYEVHVRDLSAGLPLFRVEVLHAGSNQLHGDDHRSFPTRETAEHYADQLVQCLTTEHEGISDERIAAVASGVNADLDAQQATRQAEVEQLNADIAQIMAGSRGFRGDRKTLAETVPAAESRQVRATLAGAHLADISAPQQRAIDHHRNGRVHVGQGVTRPMLTALARKGFGTLNHAPGMGRRQVVESLDLNQRGMAATRQEATR